MNNLNKTDSIEAIAKILKHILNADEICITANEKIYKDKSGMPLQRNLEVMITTTKNSQQFYK